MKEFVHNLGQKCWLNNTQSTNNDCGVESTHNRLHKTKMCSLRSSTTFIKEKTATTHSYRNK